MFEPQRIAALAIWLTLVGAPCADAQDQETAAPHLRVLPADFNADKTTQMMRSYLRTKVHAALDQRLEKLEALDSAEAIGAYQQELREVFFKAIGELPARTPLNAEVTGTLPRDGYRVEKVLFESQPKFFVTGNLYLPEAAGPHPGILLPCGHSENGKAYTAYQKAAILLAQNDFVVLCYDPIGQGERKQLLDDKGKPLLRGSGEHQSLGVAPILLGRGLSTYMIWDGMRALDYLQTRPEVDAERLGCTGNSGGGNLTAMLMALDDRIDAAAPGCFMATTRTKNEKPGPGDAEQNLFGQIRDGLDHPDFAIIRAPKPTLILAATRDFVPIEGTWVNFRQAKRLYTKLGRPEAIQLIEAPEKHGFTKTLREGAVRFFARWLQQRRLEIVEEEEVAVVSDEELQVTPNGQVAKLVGARSLLDLNREFYAANQPRQRFGDELREVVRKVTGIRNLKATVTAPSRSVEEQLDSSAMIFTPEPGISLPAYRKSHGPDWPVEVHLVVHDKGIGTTADEVETLVFGKRPPPRDYSIVGVDLRDCGETRTRNWRFYGADAYIAYMLGRSYLAMRCEDILAVARTGAEPRQGKKVRLHAWGEMVPAAIHAAALEPELFESVTLHGGLTSWKPLLDSADPMQHIHSVVHGALLHYDLSDLLPLLPLPTVLP